MFDKRLPYRSHITMLRNKRTSRTNILEVVFRMSYGADRATPLRLYHSLSISVLDYGSSVHVVALSNTKLHFNSLHHDCIRIATGAFRTSRRSSLLVDAGEMPLDLRRKRLALRYVCKVKQEQDHPSHSVDLSSVPRRPPRSNPPKLLPSPMRARSQLAERG